MKNFCPFLNGSCNSDCVFRTHKTVDADGEKVCQLSLAASDFSAFFYAKTLETENNISNPQDRK